MKLARLLAAGKSFVAARDGGHRYRLNRVSLPKFISPQNPFAPPTRTEASPAGKPDAAPYASPRPASRESPARGWLPRTDPPARGVARPARWWQAFRRFLAGRRWRRPSASGSKAAPVQRELSLDQVQVVRSDLRDEDLVVVMARPRDGAVGGGASSPKWGVVGRAWERLSSRFTTVNQT